MSVWYTNCTDYPDFVGSACPVSASITLAELSNPVYGMFTVYATPVGVSCLQFYIDGVAVGSQVVSAPWTILLNSFDYVAGDHSIYAKSCDNSVTSNTITATIAAVSTTGNRTGDRPEHKGQQRECVVCGVWYPERDVRMRKKDKQWVCKYDYDEEAEEHTRALGELTILKGMQRNCVICDFWFAETDWRIRKVRNKWLCKWCEESEYYNDDEGIPYSPTERILELETGDDYLYEDGGKIVLEDDT